MLFDSPRMGALIAALAFMLLFFIYQLVEDAPYESTKNAVCWSGPAAYAMALIQIAQYEEYQIGAQWSNFTYVLIFDFISPLIDTLQIGKLFCFFWMKWPMATVQGIE